MLNPVDTEKVRRTQVLKGIDKEQACEGVLSALLLRKVLYDCS